MRSTIHLKAVEQNFTVMLFVFLFSSTQFLIVVNLSVLDLALSGVKGFKGRTLRVRFPCEPIFDAGKTSRLLQERSSFNKNASLRKGVRFEFGIIIITIIIIIIIISIRIIIIINRKNNDDWQ